MTSVEIVEVRPACSLLQYIHCVASEMVWHLQLSNVLCTTTFPAHSKSQFDVLVCLQAILKPGPPPPPGKAESVVSTSTDSPSPGSPTSNPKSKIELKLTADGQLVFNARQRRTLRRALHRRRKHDAASGVTFEGDKDVTEEERRIIIEVVQMHIGRPLPESTDVDELVKVLLGQGTTDAEP